MSEPITVTVNLTPAAYEDLERSSYAEAETRTDVINRAIGVYAAIGAARPGQVITVTDCDGVWRRGAGSRRAWPPVPFAVAEAVMTGWVVAGLIFLGLVVLIAVYGDGGER